MTELHEALNTPWLFLYAVLAFGLAPSAVLRATVRCYPRKHPRRAELLAELDEVPYVKRPLWVASLIPVCLDEGLAARRDGRRRSKRLVPWGTWRELSLADVLRGMAALLPFGFGALLAVAILIRLLGASDAETVVMYSFGLLLGVAMGYVYLVRPESRGSLPVDPPSAEPLDYEIFVSVSPAEGGYTEADRAKVIDFLDLYSPRITVEGGALRGTLTIRTNGLRAASLTAEEALSETLCDIGRPFGVASTTGVSAKA